jgi:hypothetical protein
MLKEIATAGRNALPPQNHHQRRPRQNTVATGRVAYLELEVLRCARNTQRNAEVKEVLEGSSRRALTIA